MSRGFHLSHAVTPNSQDVYKRQEGSQAKVMEAAHMGATGYVRKPFTPEQINHVLAGLVGSPVGA